MRFPYLRLIGLLALVASLGACTVRPPLGPVPTQFTSAERADPVQLTSGDGLTLFGQWWRPAEEPKAVVLMVHGTAVHSGFYAPVNDYLRRNGYAVFGIDLRGWGQSQGFGRRGYVGHYDEYIMDVKAAYDHVRAAYPDKKLYLFGESLGGGVVLLTHIQEAFPVDGLVLSVPAVHASPGLWSFRAPHAMQAPLMWSGKALGQVFPDMPALPLWTWAGGLMSSSDATIKRFERDPYTTHGKWLPASYAHAVTRGMERIRANMHHVTAPMIILQGTSDSIMPLDGAENLCRYSRSKDKVLKVYEGGHHAMLHDGGREKAWFDIVSWLNEETEAKFAITRADCPIRNTALAEPGWWPTWLGGKPKPEAAKGS